MNITQEQYKAIKEKKGKFSKSDLKRIEKGLAPIEDEDTAQKRVVAYLELLKQEGRVIKFTAIPNNTFTGSYVNGNKIKGIMQAKKQVAMGLRRGLCDLMIVYNNLAKTMFQILFLEMKREKGGVLSEEQDEWIRTLCLCEGADAEVAYGYDDAKRIIDSRIF